MSLFNRKKTSRLFVLQEDGRLGSVTRAGVDDIEDVLAGQSRPRRGAMHRTVTAQRLKVVFTLLVMIIMLFSARAAQLQIIEGDQYKRLSAGNRNRTELVVPARGGIVDRYGKPLAWNEPTFVLTMKIIDLPEQEEDRTKLFVQVASLVGLQVTDFDLLFSEYIARPYDDIPVAEDLPYEAGIRLAIEVANFPGFSLQTKSKRVYTSGVTSMSHILGYTGSLSAVELDEKRDGGYRPIDDIGKTGVEKEAETLLRGVPGRLVYEVDARGRQLSIISKEEAVEGADISLSIDADFQKFIEKELKSTLERVGASRASIVALDPRTGAVRALVSWPSYNNNEFIGGISSERYTNLIEDDDQPLFPRAIAGEFPSGSTFKPFVAYAAMAEGIVGEHSSFLSTGGLRISQWFFPDWKFGGHGITDVRKAIAESVNTYFYIIGGGYDTVTGLGVARIDEYASRFGFGDVTGIDLPGEADGFLPTKEWKQEVKGERWYVGDTYHLAIGQGDFLTTPLQMATATAVIANGGNQVTPYLVESIDSPLDPGVLPGGLSELEDLDTYALSVVRQGMRETVTIGSARSLSGLSQAVAGKTGTAQAPGDRPYHSWFTGFGPYEDPTITLIVLIEEGGESSDAAVPLANTLLNWWFTYGS